MVQNEKSMVFTQEVLNGFEMTARTAVAEIPAVRAGYRAFVAVYPPLPDKGVFQWRVRRFEVSEDLINSYFGEEQLIDSQLIQFETREQVESLLSAWQLEDVTFSAPWKTDYLSVREVHYL